MIPRLIAAAAAWLTFVQPTVTAVHRVAVTFDDLPVVNAAAHDAASDRATTERLLAALAAHSVPATAFVIAGKAHDDPAQTALLRLWLNRGFELGNHTYSHRDFHSATLAEMEEEVTRCDDLLVPLLNERGKAVRFFRHPMLHTGRDPQVRAAFEAFLSARQYRVAPVTIDNDDYIFARAYDRAAAADDRAAIADAFLSYMEAKFAFFERNSSDLFGRQIDQILLLHANRLNADTFGDLATMIERRGYRFISLDEALKDEAYRSADTYAGPAGMTWIHRWALTKGMPKDFYRGEPDVPAFVAAAGR